VGEEEHHNASDSTLHYGDGCEACCLTALPLADVQRRGRTNRTAVWSNGGKVLRGVIRSALRTAWPIHRISTTNPTQIGLGSK